MRIDANTFSDLVSLKYLKLDSNKLSAIEQAAVTNLSSLEGLDMKNNQLKEIDSAAFVGLTYFKTLKRIQGFF